MQNKDVKNEIVLTRAELKRLKRGLRDMRMVHAHQIAGPDDPGWYARVITQKIEDLEDKLLGLGKAS